MPSSESSEQAEVAGFSGAEVLWQWQRHLRVMRRLDAGCNAGLEDFQARAEAKRVERRAQIVRVLAEVRPSVSVQRDDHGIRKRPRGFDGVVGIHGEMERAAGLRRAREWQHHAGLEAPRDFGDAVIPNRIAADVDRTDVVVLSGSAQSR